MSSYCLVGGHRVLVGGLELHSGAGIWLWESLKYRHEVVTDNKQWEPLKYRHEVINLLSSFLPPPSHLTILGSPFFSTPPPPPPISFHAPLSLTFSLPSTSLTIFLPPSPPPSLSLSYHSTPNGVGGGGGGSKISRSVTFLSSFVCALFVCSFLENNVSSHSENVHILVCLIEISCFVFCLFFTNLCTLTFFSQHWQSAMVLLLLVIVCLFVRKASYYDKTFSFCLCY